MFFLKSEKKNIKYVFSNTDLDLASGFKKAQDRTT